MITLELTNDEASFSADVIEDILNTRKQRVYGGATPDSVYDRRLRKLFEKLRGYEYDSPKHRMST